jgi:hypothetical protein
MFRSGGRAAEGRPPCPSLSHCWRHTWRSVARRHRAPRRGDKDEITEIRLPRNKRPVSGIASCLPRASADRKAGRSRVVRGPRSVVEDSRNIPRILARLHRGLARFREGSRGLARHCARQVPTSLLRLMSHACVTDGTNGISCSPMITISWAPSLSQQADKIGRKDAQKLTPRSARLKLTPLVWGRNSATRTGSF